MQQIVISCLDRRLFIRAFIFTNGGNWVDVCILPQRNMTSENDLYYCEIRVLIHYSKANLVFFPRGLLLPPPAAIPRQMIIQLAVICWKGFCKMLQTRHTQQVLSRKRQRNKIKQQKPWSSMEPEGQIKPDPENHPVEFSRNLHVEFPIPTVCSQSVETGKIRGLLQATQPSHFAVQLWQKQPTHWRRPPQMAAVSREKKRNHVTCS